jgi:hypothetical protein
VAEAAFHNERASAVKCCGALGESEESPRRSSRCRFPGAGRCAEIEALAKRRLADEYEAAQERGKWRRQTTPIIPDQNNCPVQRISAFPAKTFTKPARSAMQNGATGASFAGLSMQQLPSKDNQAGEAVRLIFDCYCG